MSAHLSRLVTFSTLFCSLFAFAASGRATQITLQSVPPLTVEQAPAYPENVARYHAGATLQVAPRNNTASSLALSSKATDVNTAEAALLCDDPTVGYVLAPGKSNILVSLAKIENIDSVSLYNRGAKGEMTVSIADANLPASSSQWREVSHQQLTGDAMKLKIGPSEAKYVRLSFDISEQGRVSALGVYSTPTMAAFTSSRPRKENVQGSDDLALISYNLTDIHAKGRAVYVSSGETVKDANHMIDEQPTTTYSFGPNDVNPTVVIDLGKLTKLRRISTVYSQRQGNVDFFVAQSLPGNQSPIGKHGSASRQLHLDDIAFADMQMVGSVAGGRGLAAVDFPETTGRYIVLRWTPVPQENAVFSVAEIAAFGRTIQGSLLAANNVGNNGEGIESDGKSVQDGKDAKDLGEGKDIPAEAPAEGPAPGLPDPPPFVFVPEVVPNSP